MNKKLVIFDFDGVLIHTMDLALSIIKGVNPEFTREDLNMYGEGNFLKQHEDAVQKGLADPEHFDEEYLKGIKHLRFQHLMPSLIKKLSEEYILAIVSSSDTEHIKSKLAEENVKNLFADILGSDVSISKGPKIHSLLNHYSLSPSDAVYITDTTGDILEARECAVAAIGVTWGMHDRERLARREPWDIVDTISELESSIKRFFGVQ